MKTLSTLITAMAIFITIGFNINAQVPSASQIADAFAKQKVTYYRGKAYFNGGRSITCTIQKVTGGHWGITQLAIDGVELPIDSEYPLWELPAFKGSVTNFNFWVQGYDGDNQSTRFGSFYTSELKPGDDIGIVVYLQNVYKSLPYKMPAGQNANNTALQDDKGNDVGWYDDRSKSWNTGFDPLNPPKEWRVVDLRSGAVIDKIPFDGKGNPPVQNGNGISLVNQGDIPEVTLDSQGNWYGRLNVPKLNHDVFVGTTLYDGKVILTSVSRDSDYMQLYIHRLRSGSIIQVFGYTDGGVELMDQQQTKTGEAIEFNNLTGHQTYKIVIVGAIADPVYGLNVQAYDTTYKWNIGNGGGGGMGAPVEETVAVSPPEVSTP